MQVTTPALARFILTVECNLGSDAMFVDKIPGWCLSLSPRNGKHDQLLDTLYMLRNLGHGGIERTGMKTGIRVWAMLG